MGVCNWKQVLRLKPAPRRGIGHQAHARGLQVQCTIGRSDYAARDAALKALIQPLAGEYGMHKGEAQGARSLWSVCWPVGSLRQIFPGVGCIIKAEAERVVVCMFLLWHWEAVHIDSQPQPQTYLWQNQVNPR